MAPFVDENIPTSPVISVDFSKLQTTAAKAEVFGLETSALLNIHLEDMAFSSQVAEVENWWSSPRFAGIQRPYTAEQICGARGSLVVPYASDALSKKLWSILEKRAKVSCIHLVGVAVAGGPPLHSPSQENSSSCPSHRIERQVQHLGVWTLSRSRRWQSTSTPSTYLAGSALLPLRLQTSHLQTWLTTPWYVLTTFSTCERQDSSLIPAIIIDNRTLSL